MSKLAQSILIFSSRRFEKPASACNSRTAFSKRLVLKNKIDCASLDIRINPRGLFAVVYCNALQLPEDLGLLAGRKRHGIFEVTYSKLPRIIPED